MSKAKKHITELFPAYLDGVLSDKEKVTVESHLKECESCSKELEQLTALFGAINSEKEQKPSPRLQINFLEDLEKEKILAKTTISNSEDSSAVKQPWVINFMKIAASILLLFGAFALGKYQQEEKFNQDIALLETESLEMTQTAMLSLMDNQSARKRIQGVNFITEFENPDEAIINALTDRMLLDPNTNVRLSAVDALARFAKSETVKSAFINALATEKNPSVQIAIIENLVRIQETKASAAMKKLMEQEDTQPFVKKELNRVLSEIKS